MLLSRRQRLTPKTFIISIENADQSRRCKNRYEFNCLQNHPKNLAIQDLQEDAH